MATTIDPVSGFSVIPNREDGEATFSTDADTWVSEMDNVTTTMNTTIDQINTVSVEIEEAATAAASSANYQGLWSGKTNAGTVGQSYGHNDNIWSLNVALANISTSEPSLSNSDWSLNGNATLTGDNIFTGDLSIVKDSPLIHLNGTENTSATIRATESNGAFGYEIVYDGIQNDISFSTIFNGPSDVFTVGREARTQWLCKGS